MLSREVASKIKLVGLEAKANAFAQNLSGGQKRKLCIAMAFVNDPQCVVLDEPTSGVDPVSRRQLWELIRDRARSSQNVVLMTTHFMDEANLLGDRISILSKGYLRCCGSPLFLKNRFGAGYVISIETQNATLHDDVAEELVSAVKAKLLQKHGEERQYQIEEDKGNALPEILQRLRK